MGLREKISAEITEIDYRLREGARYVGAYQARVLRKRRARLVRHLADIPQPVTHQFALFSQKVMRRSAKVPISAARIREAKALFACGDNKGAERAMRQVREALEAFEARLSNLNQKR